MKTKDRILLMIVFVASALILYPNAACRTQGDEHPEEVQGAQKQAGQKKEPPEHPKDKPKGTEHPEDKAKQKQPITTQSLAQAITGHIKKDTGLKGGYFCVFDGKAKTPLALTLEKVHQDKLAKVSEGLYFACSDFKATNGKKYDLDFFMKNTDRGLEVSEIMIHKEDGLPRYNWVEEQGMWKRR